MERAIAWARETGMITRIQLEVTAGNAPGIHLYEAIHRLPVPGNRAEQLASQILAHGRPLPTEEIIQRIDAVDAAQLARLAGRLMAGRPTLAALGPIGRLARLESVAGRLAA